MDRIWKRSWNQYGVKYRGIIDTITFTIVLPIYLAMSSFGEAARVAVVGVCPAGA